MRVRVIVNPRAGGGRAGKKLEALTRALDERDARFEIVPTGHAGHATELAREAREDGVDVLGITGGDGTFNEVSQAYIDDQGAPIAGPAIAVIPAGTGGDFRKTLEHDHSIEAAVARIVDGKNMPADLGVLTLTGDDDSPKVCAFINIASFGVGGLADRIVNGSPKWMGGRTAFLLGTLRAMLQYRNQPVKVSVDGEPFIEDRIINVAIANGRYFGGGMKIAPNAELDDGLFDVVSIGDMSFAASAALGRKLYSGAHLDAAKVSFTRGKVVRAEALCEEPVLIDLDGETPGKLPLTATIAPGAIQIRR
jgi:diacylglycerol kinase (ATP)